MVYIDAKFDSSKIRDGIKAIAKWGALDLDKGQRLYCTLLQNQYCFLKCHKSRGYMANIAQCTFGTTEKISLAS